MNIPKNPIIIGMENMGGILAKSGSASRPYSPIKLKAAKADATIHIKNIKIFEKLKLFNLIEVVFHLNKTFIE